MKDNSRPGGSTASAPRAAKARVVLADRSDVIRAGMRAMLERLGDMEVVGEATDYAATLQLCRDLAPDILILDVSPPAPDVVEFVPEVLRQRPNLKVIGCSGDGDQQTIAQVFRTGCSGYLCTDSSAAEIAVALRAVRKGDVYLSPRAAEVLARGYIRSTAMNDQQAEKLSLREREVLQLLVEGKTNREMSNALGISVKTVESHRAKLMEKLGIFTVAELTKYAIREGLTTVEN
jgi:DNA-binding NarL/FixJ family response regulator